MILVDTSPWVDHLRRGNRRLAALLNNAEVLCHRFVIGELALGSLVNRAAILDYLTNLPAVPVAEHDEVLALVERRELMGTGIGWIDAHLLASSLLAGVPLWTLDKPLAKQAQRLGVAAAI